MQTRWLPSVINSVPKARWGSLLAGVILVAGGVSVGCGGSTTSERCGSVQTINGQPKAVVIFLDGIGSEQDDTGSFNPLTVNYCPVDPAGNDRYPDHGWPTGLSAGLGRWAEFPVPGAPEASRVCEVGGGLTGPSCLVARLADAGAVLLPYSYTGATLSSTPSGPVFKLSAYHPADTQQEPYRSVDALDAELASINSVWPHTQIVIVGHSYGGLVAELWMECVWRGHFCSVQNAPSGWPRQHAQRNVFHVFSLDSPINGVSVCSGSVVVFGSSVNPTICWLWDHHQDHDQQILADPIAYYFTAVGTPNDPTYTHGLGDLKVQTIQQCSGGVAFFGEQCELKQPPSYVSSDPDCDGGSGNIYGTTGHDIVKVCPDVVHLIVAGVRVTGSSQLATPTPSAPSACSAPTPVSGFTWFAGGGGTYCLNYPSSWTAATIPTASGRQPIATFVSPDRHEDFVVFVYNYTPQVRNIEIDGGQVANYAVAQGQGHIYLNPLTQSTVTLGAITWTVLSGDTIQASGATFDLIVWYVAHAGNVFAITFAAPQATFAARTAADFQPMIESFTFTT